MKLFYILVNLLKKEQLKENYLIYIAKKLWNQAYAFQVVGHRSVQVKTQVDFADQLIEAVPVLEDGYDDDRTVLVASIWEKGHRNVE